MADGGWVFVLSFSPNIPDRVNFWQVSFLANSGLRPEELGTATEGEYVGLFLTRQVGSKVPHDYWNS
jgi:hypothetical protein